MRLLDIVVTHYKEQWETGKKFFEMLALQRAVNFDDFRVILVNDGEEGALPPVLLSEYPYHVDVITVPHGGVSAARNAGIEKADAKWVNFCDFDDTYASVYSLKQVMDVLPSDNYDLLYADFIAEDITTDGRYILNTRGQNVVFIHGKYWRREWLMQSGLRFNPALHFNEDSAFCAIANNMMDYKRTGHIDSTIPIYVWCFSNNSATTTPGNRIKCIIGLYERNKLVCESFKEKGDYKRYCGMVSRVVHDAYWGFNLENVPEELTPYIDDFKRFWKEHKQNYFDTDPELLQEVAEISRKEHEAGDNEELARFRKNEIKTNSAIGLSQWLFNLEQ